MSELTRAQADEVRAIIREELDQREAIRKEAAEISGSFMRVQTEAAMLAMVDSYDLPEAEREKLLETMKRAMDGIGL